MNALHTVVVVLQVISALAIIGLVLLQHGKGADMGAAFGSGASGSLFGATGSSNFLSKSTGLAAAVFFAATLGLAFMGNKSSATGGVMDNLPASPTPSSAPTAAPDTSGSTGNTAPTQGGSISKESASPAAGQANQIPK